MALDGIQSGANNDAYSSTQVSEQQNAAATQDVNQQKTQDQSPATDSSSSTQSSTDALNGVASGISNGSSGDYQNSSVDKQQNTAANVGTQSNGTGANVENQQKPDVSPDFQGNAALAQDTNQQTTKNQENANKDGSSTQNSTDARNSAVSGTSNLSSGEITSRPVNPKPTDVQNPVVGDQVNPDTHTVDHQSTDEFKLPDHFEFDKRNTDADNTEFTRQLQQIQGTDSGKELLNQISSTGKTTTLAGGEFQPGGAGYRTVAVDGSGKPSTDGGQVNNNDIYLRPDKPDLPGQVGLGPYDNPGKVTNGSGTDALIYGKNPNNGNVGYQAPGEDKDTAASIALYHELSHAYNYETGTTQPGQNTTRTSVYGGKGNDNPIINFVSDGEDGPGYQNALKGGIIEQASRNGEQQNAVYRNDSGELIGYSQRGSLIANREMQVVDNGQQSTGYKYFNDGQSTNNPLFATENEFRRELNEPLRPAYRF